MAQVSTAQESANLTFLALAVWREARGEGRPGMAAVAHSIMNRVKRPSWWGSDLQSVVFKKWQYSSLTDPKDRQLSIWPSSGDAAWHTALEVSQGTIDGTVKNPAPGADSYFDVSIPAPNWADQGKFVAQIGKIRFYNLDQDCEK